MPRVVVCDRIGPYKEVLRLCEQPPLAAIPAGMLHVRVGGAGVGFPDLLQVEGRYQLKAEPPFVPVNYIAGEVIAVGPEVDPSWNVGSRVVGSAGLSTEGHLCGGLAEQALVSAATASLLPDCMSYEVALAMHENYWDVHHAVSTVGCVSSKDTLLVLGAAGACGQAAVDLGRAYGARVVACAAGAAKLEACRAAGADVVLDYEAGGENGFIASLKEAKVYGNVSVVFDPVGGRYAEAAFRAMAPGGRYVVFGFASGGTDPKSAFPQFPINLLLMRGQQLLGSMGSSRGDKIAEMFEMVKEGRLRPAVTSRTYPLEDFEQAFEDLASRRAIGKVIVSPLKASRL